MTKTFNYLLFLKRESLELLLFNIIYFGVILFFSYNILDIATLITVEGLIICIFWCLAVLFFPKFIITQYKKIIQVKGWSTFFGRLINVIKVFLICTITMGLFFYIDYFILSGITKTTLQPEFFTSLGFIFMLVIITLKTLKDFFGGLLSEKKVIRIKYAYVTRGASYLGVFFMVFVFYIMTVGWLAVFFPVINEFSQIILAFLFVAARFLTDFEFMHDDYFQSLED